MSDIQVGDRVAVAGYGQGVVLSKWGAYASVEFPSGSRHVPLNQVTSIDAKERRRKEEQAREEWQRKVEQDLERDRLKSAVRDKALSELQDAMRADFLGVDDLYQSTYSDALDRPAFFRKKGGFRSRMDCSQCQCSRGERQLAR